MADAYDPPWSGASRTSRGRLGDWVLVQARAARFNLIEAARLLQRRKRSGQAVPLTERSALSYYLVGETLRALVESEGDVERILASPLTMVASDGEIPVFGRGAPHPRSYGTFARVLGVYVREKRLLTLEEAVRKMTSFPAARMGLADRGLVRPGMKADLVVFDPETVRDRATFEKPHRYAEGLSLVLVNGAAVLDGDRTTGARPGRVLRGAGSVPAVAY